MSKKLTEQLIDEMIADLLQEKEFPFQVDSDEKALDVYNKDKHKMSTKQKKGFEELTSDQKSLAQKIKNLAKTDGSKDELEQIDILRAKEAGKGNDLYNTASDLSTNARNAETRTLISQILSGDYIPVENPETFGGDSGRPVIDIDKQTYDPESIAFGQMANIGSQNDPTSSSPLGKFPEGLSSSINSFFQGTKSFYQRVEKVSSFSNAIIANEEVDEDISVPKLLAGSLFMDYLTTIVKEIDSGAGAYQFETLLAAMAGGSVTGKGDVDTDSGTMGAVDFVMNDGSYGSAKYYSSLSSISQAISGFKNKKGKQILYIIAHKKPKVTKRRTKTGVSDPSKIKSIIIYFVSVVPLKDNPTVASDFLISIGERPQRGTSPSGDETRLDLFPFAAKSAGGLEIQLVADDNGMIKAALKKATETESDNMKKAVSSFKEVFSKLYSANQKAQRYASTGNAIQGNAALDVMVQADDALIDLVAAINPERVDADKATAAKAKKTRRDFAIKEESKFESLDQLIAETIRDIKKNNK